MKTKWISVYEQRPTEADLPAWCYSWHYGLATTPMWTTADVQRMLDELMLTHWIKIELRESYPPAPESVVLMRAKRAQKANTP